ncbi:MAG TPA: LruC domain-containing protein, partial [Bacteroidia bacterium]|nr:LruC domain-containing protein [Bacteroidia bacterium]
MKIVKVTLAAILAVTALNFTSCKRDIPSGDKNENPGGEVIVDAKDIVTPAQFNFETEKELSIRVKVATTSFPGEKFVIKIHGSVPSKGDVISTGITSASSNEYSTKVRIPAWQESIFIEKINADGSSEFQQVKAGQFIAATFTGKPDDGTYTFPKTFGSGMTCNCNSSNTINNHTGSVDVKNNQTKCFTGTINGSITVKNGGTIKVCASGTITGLTIEGTGKVYILENTTLSLSNLNCNSSSNTFKSWSDSVTTSGSISVQGDWRNYGKMYVNGDFNINSNGDAENEGTLNVSGNLNNNEDFENYNKVTVSGNLNNNSNSDLSNYCYLRVNGDFTNNGDVINKSFIKVGNTYTQNSNTSTNMYSLSALYAKNLMVNGDFNGNGLFRAKLKATNTTTINSNGDINGNLDLCDSNGIETNNGDINWPAASSCAGYIASSSCFPDGFGQPAIQDADGDNVADAQDEYPNDADRAFNSYYPSANTTATLAFEDLWPTSGDYDYNDLVLAFNVHKVLNAENKVVDYKVKMKVKAIGASFDNGFGFRLDEVMPNEVASVAGQVITKSIINRSGNNTEANQDRAVIICYDSPEPTMQRAAGSMFNTIKANGTGTSDTVRVDVTFASPVDDSKLDISKFNP